jgi:hypothetical protein
MTLERLALLSSLAAALAVAPSAANAGFFESLFGGSPFFQRPQPFVVQPYGQVPPPRHKPRAVEAEKPTPAEIAAIRATTLMTDKTLRDGDVVMTAQGIRIFEGPPGSRHTADDFIRIDQDRRLPKAERAELVAINAYRDAGDAWQEAGETPVRTGRSVAVTPAGTAKPVRRVTP